jgi:hypothetical protein
MLYIINETYKNMKIVKIVNCEKFYFFHTFHQKNYGILPEPPFFQGTAETIGA